MKTNDTIFGLSKAEIERQCKANPMRYDRDEPIHKDEFLEPCIRGGEKILADPKLRNMLKRIYLHTAQ